MFPETIGHRYDVGRVVPACCIKNDPLEKIKIKENCFFLLLIRKGKVVFDVAGRNFEAEGPCFVCFDEKENPVVIDKTELECYAVYFHPMFLNVNMTFECVHSKDFAHVATAHDLFLLKPFTDEKQYVFPLASKIMDENDSIRIKLYHIMATDSITGISDIGIRVGLE